MLDESRAEIFRLAPSGPNPRFAEKLLKQQDNSDAASDPNK